MHPAMAWQPRPARCARCNSMYDCGSNMKLRQFISIFSCLSLLAQVPQTPTFRTTTNLVIVNVTVRDKSGKLVDNLKKEDFTLLEDDKSQAISVFELERLTSETLPVLVPSPQSPTSSPARRVAPSTSPPPTPQPPVPRKHHRRLPPVFDFSSLQPPEQVPAQQTALKF